MAPAANHKQVQGCAGNLAWLGLAWLGLAWLGLFEAEVALGHGTDTSVRTSTPFPTSLNISCHPLQTQTTMDETFNLSNMAPQVFECVFYSVSG